MPLERSTTGDTGILITHQLTINIPIPPSIIIVSDTHTTIIIPTTTPMKGQPPQITAIGMTITIMGRPHGGIQGTSQTTIIILMANIKVTIISATTKVIHIVVTTI